MIVKDLSIMTRQKLEMLATYYFVLEIPASVVL